MNGAELYKARIELGRRWRFGRAVFAAELGRALGNPATDKGELIRNCEARRDEQIPWALAASVNMLLAGSMPPNGLPERLYDYSVKRDRRQRAMA